VEFECLAALGELVNGRAAPQAPRSLIELTVDNAASAFGGHDAPHDA
jgi:hypothetical protein